MDTIEKLLLPSFLNYLRLKKLTNMFYFESRKPTSHAIKIKNVPSNRTCPKVNIRRRLLWPHGDQRLINFTQAVMPLYKSSILPQKSCTVSLLKLFLYNNEKKQMYLRTPAIFVKCYLIYRDVKILRAHLDNLLSETNCWTNYQQEREWTFAMGRKPASFCNSSKEKEVSLLVKRISYAYL